MMSKGGAMTSAYEYEQVMRAAMQYGSDKTVEEVVEEQERQREEHRIEAQMKRPTRSIAAAPKAAPTAAGRPRVGQAIPKGRMDELQALLAKVPPAEVASPPDE